MYDKLRISGKIVVESGLHIGGSSQFSAIGAVDSPVIRDTVTNQPIIPGSSLKGKMRTLLSRYYSENNIVNEPNNDPEKIKYLFGSSKKSKKQKIENTQDDIIIGRLQFIDAQLSNKDFFDKHLLDSAVEVKFENSIDRLTAEANPRQIERVIRDAEFEFQIMYDAWFEEVLKENLMKKVEDDFITLGNGIALLQLDYLGGNGSRGYGKIKFKSLTVEHVFGDCANFDLKKLKSLLEKELK